MREPEERSYFDGCVRATAGRRHRVPRRSDRTAKQELLGDATCLLNPIAWPEPFGMVMIEALACGTPVVATPRGAAPEIIRDGHNGFLADDEEGFITALKRVTNWTDAPVVTTPRNASHTSAWPPTTPSCTTRSPTARPAAGQ